MKKLLLLLLLSLPAFGQNTRYDNVALGPRGPIPFAAIAVCQQPANVSAAPCTPLANLCSSASDAVCTSPNPINADVLGNYHFYVKGGQTPFTVQIYGPQVAAPSVMTDQTAGSLSVGGNNAFTGNNTHSGTEAFTNAMTTGYFNNVRIVDGTKFATIQSAITDIMATGNTGIGHIYLPPGYTETFTSQIDLGSSSRGIVIHAFGGAQLTCNITAGGTNVCFNAWQGSGIVGECAGSWGSNNGCLTILVPATANISKVFDTPQGLAGQGGQSYVTLNHVLIRIAAGATVSTAGINLEGITGNVDVNNVFIFAGGAGTLTTKLVRIASNATNGTGPFPLVNVFADCTGNAGCVPLRIEANTRPILPIDVFGGYYNHPGNGLNIIEADASNAVSIGSIRGLRLATYVENSAAGTGSIGIKIVDCWGVSINALKFSMQPNDTAIDISETGAGRTSNISVISSSGFGATNHLVNHITSETLGVASFNNIQHYSYGGESTALVAPYTISGQNTHINNNNADAAMEMFLNSGATAIQTTRYTVSDRGTGSPKWSFGKDTANALALTDRATAVNVMAATTGTFTDLNSQGTSPIRFNRVGSTGGWQLYANTSTIQASINGTGIVDNYNGLATAGPGVAPIRAVATVVIGSGSDIAATSLCSTTLCPAGTYEVDTYVDMTTPCGTSGTFIAWLGYTDDSGARTGSSTTTFLPLDGVGAAPGTGTLTTTSTSNFGQAQYTLRTTGAATGGLGSINYGVTRTACGSAGPMVGSMYLVVKRIQ